MLVFVSGGVRSGKSTFAEQLVMNESKNRKLHYIATSKRIDTEMDVRIAHHKKRRGAEWITWERPLDVQQLRTHISNRDFVLLDCLTILTANELFREGKIQCVRSVSQKLLHDIHELTHVKKLVIVSNDVFSNGIPEDEGTFKYMKLLGTLHQEIVQQCDLAFQVIHGIPKQMKGHHYDY